MVGQMFIFKKRGHTASYTWWMTRRRGGGETTPATTLVGLIVEGGCTPLQEDVGRI